MAGLSANERRIVELVLKATGDADLKRMVAELKATRTAAEGAQKSLGGIGGALSSAGKFATGFIGALGVSTVISWGRAILDAADALDAAAEQAGIGVERYQSLKQAFRTLEVDTKEFTTGMEKLGNVLSEVLAGNASKQVIASLKSLGVYSKILSGEVHDVEGFVDALAGSQKVLNNELTVTSDLIPLVGAKLAGDFSSAFRSGALATEEARVQMETFGVVSEAELKKLAEASEIVEQAYNTVTNAILIATANTISGIQAMYNSLSDENFKNIMGKGASDRAGQAVNAWTASGGQAGLDRLLREITPPKPPVIPHRGGGGGGGGGGSSGPSAAEQRAAAMEKIYRQNLKDVSQALEDRREAQARAREEQADFVKELEQAVNPELAYAERIAKLNDLFLTRAAREHEVAEAMRERDEAQRQLIESSPEWQKANQAMLDGFDKQRAQIEATREQWEYYADVVGQAVYDVISGSAKVTDAIKKMVASILAEVARIAAIKLAAQIVASLFGGTGGVGKSAGTVGTGAPKLFAAGGIITGPTAVSTAGGGIGIAGEAGPEVVAPLRRDSSGNMGVGAVAPRVTVNNYAGAEVRTSQTSDGLQIDIMRRVIADDIRRGGNPVASAIEGAYRVGRQASAFG